MSDVPALVKFALQVERRRPVKTNQNEVTEITVRPNEDYEPNINKCALHGRASKEDVHGCVSCVGKNFDEREGQFWRENHGLLREFGTSE